MKYNCYPKRDAIKNYFPLPNELFILGLNAGEISIYSYLLYLENRKTFQCWPSYKNIGKAVNMSQNTVRKYVLSLRTRRSSPLSQRPSTPSPVKSATALCSTPSVPFRKRWICSTPGRWRGRTRMWQSSARRRSWQHSPPLPPVSRCVGLWRARRVPRFRRKRAVFKRGLGDERKSRIKDWRRQRHLPGHNCPLCGQLREIFWYRRWGQNQKRNGLMGSLGQNIMTG